MSEPTPATHAKGSALQGVLLILTAVFLFALSDVIGKHLFALYAVSLVMVVRNIVTLAMLAAVFGKSEGAGLWRTNRTALVILRGACIAAGSLTMGLALTVMPLGETVSIIYLSPFAVMILAALFMGERVPLGAWIATLFGFAGILLIVRPGSGLDPWGVTLALLNAGCATAYALFSRVLARTETTMAMLFYNAVVALVVFGGILLFAGTGPLPDLPDFGLMLLLGALASVGHFLFTAAYREAPASLLAPVNYMHMVWAGLLGWVFFDHLPDPISLCGMAFVLSAGVAVALRSRRAET
jgi:drug/metabolite transporter (DMT)-like permease